jgi:hypothetical protein
VHGALVMLHLLSNRIDRSPRSPSCRLLCRFDWTAAADATRTTLPTAPTGARQLAAVRPVPARRWLSYRVRVECVIEVAYVNVCRSFRRSRGDGGDPGNTNRVTDARRSLLIGMSSTSAPAAQCIDS